jgi:hypothetical protein
MKSSVKIITAVTFLGLAIPCIVSAEDKPAAAAAGATTTASPAKGKTKYTPLYAQVESINDTQLVVKGEGDTKFVINAETKITKDKAHKEVAKPSDVKVGQWIGGSFTKDAEGNNVLHSLHLGVSQKGELAKPKAKE